MWQTFGFENIKKYFEKEVAEDSLQHAYLFSGQEMIGKKTFAMELLGQISHTDPLSTSTRRCQEKFLGRCFSPTRISSESSSGCIADLPVSLDSFIPDLLLLENQVGIDEIR